MLIEKTGIRYKNEIKIDGNMQYASIYCNLLFMIFNVNICMAERKQNHISMSRKYSIFDLSQQKCPLLVLPVIIMLCFKEEKNNTVKNRSVLLQYKCSDHTFWELTWLIQEIHYTINYWIFTLFLIKYLPSEWIEMKKIFSIIE